MVEHDTFKLGYTWEIEFFTDDGTVKLEPSTVKTVTKSCVFTETFAPILEADILFSGMDIDMIRRNMESILCNITLTKLKYVSDPEDTGSISIVDSSIVIMATFVPTFDDGHMASARGHTTHETAENDEWALEVGPDISLSMVTVFFTNVSYNILYKKSYNMVAKAKKNGRINIGSVIQYILENNSSIKGYIVDMPDNQILQKYFIIPAGNFRFAMDFLQVNYGIYSKGLALHFDSDEKFYMLSKLSDSHESEEGEISKVFLNVSTDANDVGATNVTGYDDTFATHYMHQSIIDKTIAIAEGEAKGDSIVFSNAGFASSAFTFVEGELDHTNSTTRDYLRATLSHSKTGHGISFDYDELNNPFGLFSALAEDGLNSIYVARTSNFDCELLKPNITYGVHVESEDDSVNDKFRDKDLIITAYVQNFTRASNDPNDKMFTSDEIITLADVSGVPNGE